MKWKALLALVAAFAGGNVAGRIVNSMNFVGAESSLDSEWKNGAVDGRSQVREAALTFIGSENMTGIDDSKVRDHSTEYEDYEDFRITRMEMRALSALAKEDPKAALLGLAGLHDLPPSGIRLVAAAVLTVVAERNPEAALQWMLENSSRLIQPNRDVLEIVSLEREVWRKVASTILSQRPDSDNLWIQEIINSGSQVGSEVALEVVSQRDSRRAVELINQNLDKTRIIEDIENGFVNGFFSGSSIPSTDEAIELHEWLSGTFTGRQKRIAEFKLLKHLIVSGQLEGAREIVSRFEEGSERRRWEGVISRAPE